MRRGPRLPSGLDYEFSHQAQVPDADALPGSALASGRLLAESAPG